MREDDYSFIRNLKVLASPASSCTEQLECTLSLKHHAGDESGAFLLKAPAGILGLHNDQQQQHITLIYNAENLQPDLLSLDDVSQLPKDACRIARSGKPKWKTMSLKLKHHCPILCPDLGGDILRAGSDSDSPLNVFINLAQAKEITILFDFHHLHRDKQAQLPSILRRLNKCKSFPIREPKGLHLVDNYQLVFGCVIDVCPPLPHPTDSKKRLASSSPPPPYSKRIHQLSAPEAKAEPTHEHPPPSSPTEKATTVASTYSQPSLSPCSPTASHASIAPSSPCKEGTPIASPDYQPSVPPSPSVEKASVKLSVPSSPPVEKATGTAATPRASPVAALDDQQSVKDVVKSYLPKALESVLNRLLLEFLTTTFLSSSPAPSSLSSSSRSPSPSPSPTQTTSPKLLISHVHKHILPKAREHVKAEIEAVFVSLADRAHNLRSLADDEFIEGIEDHKLDVALIKDDAITELHRERDDILRQLEGSVAEILEEADAQVNILYSEFISKLDNSVESKKPPPKHKRISLNIPGLRDDAVRAYCEWHCSQVRSEDQKKQYQLARDLTLDEGLDLELVHEDQDYEFYVKNGVLVGVARRFVRDVEEFVRGYRERGDEEVEK